MSEPESSDGQQPESTTEPEVIDESEPESMEEIALERAATKEEREEIKEVMDGPQEVSEEEESGTTTGYHMDSQEADEAGVDDGLTEDEKAEKKDFEEGKESDYDEGDAVAEADEAQIEEDAVAEAEPEEKAEEAPKAEPEDDGNSHLFAVRTTGGQEKIVMRSLEARIKMGKFWHEQSGRDIIMNIQSVLLLSDLKGYVVVEAQDASAMFDSIQGIRHVRGQLRGELTYNEIDKYLIKKSTVLELAVENTVEIIGGPFKGMKATITRLDQEKEEATVILTDASYQLPVTIDANYLKLVTT